MAGWADEIDDGPLARRLLDQPIVLFRTESGHATALIDRCPHRFAPLSRGRVMGESLQCGYHGLAFGANGACSFSPFGIAVPPQARVRSFPVVERYGCLWIWPGAPELADPGGIPDFGFHVDSNYRAVRGYSHIKAHFEVVTDNLMDLTHTRYLHPGFGGDSYVPAVSFSQEGETVFAHYDLPSYPPHEFSEAFIPAGGRPIKERDTMRWNAPASMYLSIEMAVAEAPEVQPVHQPSSHILTPETGSTCHYFWASAGPKDCPVVDEEHYEGVKYAFDNEDAPMLEAVQANMEARDFWALQPAILAYDNAAIRARRIMRTRLKAENGSAAGGGAAQSPAPPLDVTRHPAPA
jgi:vanillate O-demethylase monooxygenase subunit